MGYRVRLSRIAKAEREKYKGKTYEELAKIHYEDEDAYFSPHEIDGLVELYEIGKGVDYNDGLEDFFDFDVYDCCECDFHIMTKEVLKQVITEYHMNTFQYYKNLLENTDKWENHLTGQLREWTVGTQRYNMLPYYLDEDKTDGEIVKSWKYEYAIFNLVYIYRTFDWENDYLIYSGW